MVNPITGNIYTIPVPLPNNPLKNLNVYFIRGPRNLLIDTGFHQEACREALCAGLRELNADMAETDIFLTHLHSDHTGLAPDIATPTTKVFIGEHDLSHLPGAHSTFRWADSDQRFAAEGFPRDLLQVLTVKNPAQGLSPLPFDHYIPVSQGEIFSYGGHRFRAIHTPGHTPGHLCLWEEETGILISGDHVLFDITPNITRWHCLRDSLGLYLSSLEAVDKLPVRMPLPAHRQVHCDFHQRCKDLMTHHQARCQEVLQILSVGAPCTAWDIAAQMTWRIRAKNWDEFPIAQKWFAVGEAMAHLDHLIALGAVEKSWDGTLYRYETC